MKINIWTFCLEKIKFNKRCTKIGGNKIDENLKNNL